MYFETHAHYDHPQFSEDQAMLLPSLHQQGVEYIVNIGTNLSSSKKSITLAEVYSFVYATVGFHPHDAKKMKKEDMATLEKLTNHNKVVALGEIGLDFFYDNSPRDIQTQSFEDQLALAKKLEIPVVIHCRDAHSEVYHILKEAALSHRNGKGAGVMHCFSGNLPMAKKYIDMGYIIGIGGVVTYKNAKDLHEVVSHIPLEHIIIETDAPYLAPVPNRGKRNDSSNLQYIAKTIGELKNISKEDVALETMNNAKKFYM